MLFVDFHTHKSYKTPDVLAIRSYQPSEVINPAGFFTVGVHPWNPQETEINKLNSLLKKYRSQIVAIGEIGIDKTKPQFSQQLEIFLSQLSIAEESKLPVVIHCVKCFDILLKIRNEHTGQKWFVHGFNGKEQLARQLLDKEIFLSFGKNLITTAVKFQKYLPSLPADSFFLETDTATNNIVGIYDAAAKILNITVAELQSRIINNLNKHFNGILERKN